MIDNYAQIVPLLKFEEGTFYYLQVLQRKKDNPEMSWQTKQRYFKFIRTLEELETYNKEAREIADFYNARVYISLTPRSFEKLSLEALVELSIRIKNKDFSSNFKIFEKLALLPGCAKKDGKLWMIDYDEKSDPHVSDLIILLNNTYKVPFKELLETGTHDVVFGIRPEDVYLEDDPSKENPSAPITLKCDMSELLGHERIVYTDLNDKERIIIKVNAQWHIKSGDDNKYVFNLERLNICDPVTTRNILCYYPEEK